MKNVSLFLVLFSFLIAKGQITLEHTFDGNQRHISRVKLEYSGEKYYMHNKATNEMVFYNADYSFWKSIQLPAVPPPALSSGTIIFHVSEAKINPDANIEIIFSQYHNGAYETIVCSENGTILLTIPNADWVDISEIAGLPIKIIASNSSQTLGRKVYSVPQLLLENTYPYENLKRIVLENSGEKYYVLDTVSGEAKIYNADHTLWKSISLPLPANAIYSRICFISETKINPDALLEVGYSYHSNASNPIYESNIINENGMVLKTIPGASSVGISVLAGYPNKLLVGIASGTSVYELPSLILEHTYDSQMDRVLLENSGAKYLHSSYVISDMVSPPSTIPIVIYNNDHTLWKTINFTSQFPFAGYFNINSISETKINSDALLELVICTRNDMLLEPQYESRVVQENGTILLDVFGATNMYISEMQGSATKLIADFGDANYQLAFSSNVYGLAPLRVTDFENNAKNLVFPNPANSYLNIQTGTFPIVEATVYSSNGVLVKQIKSPNITKIDVENLPTGTYILNLIAADQLKSVHKIILTK
jgi:hypothetical protein